MSGLALWIGWAVLGTLGVLSVIALPFTLIYLFEKIFTLPTRVESETLVEVVEDRVKRGGAGWWYMGLKRVIVVVGWNKSVRKKK